MNLSNPISTLCAAITFTVSAQIGLASPMQGGSAGGGGNSRTPVRADAATIQRFIYGEMRELLPLIFNSFARTDLTSPVSSCKFSESLCQKLFSGPRTIYDVIQWTRPDISEVPCRDNEGRHSGGHARNGQICLSPSQIARENYAVRDFKIYVASLAAHEYAHLVGADEIEANQIQDAIESSIILDTGVESDVAAIFHRISGTDFEMGPDFKRLRNQVNRMSFEQKCLAIIQLHRKSEELASKVRRFEYRTGLRIWDRLGQLAMMSFTKRADNLLSYCAAEAAPREIQAYVNANLTSERNRKFPVAEDSMSLRSSFFHIGSSQYAESSFGSMSDLSGIIYNLQNQNREQNIQLELNLYQQDAIKVFRPYMGFSTFAD